MRKIRWIGLLVLLGFPLSLVQADGWRKETFDHKFISEDIKGKVIDYTANHGKDNRMWSRALWERRDMYVYLPPHYNPSFRYPILIWMHGFADDEQSFLRHVVPALDAAIASGKLPPLIVAAPDGSLKGEPHQHKNASFFVNSNAGSYEDLVLQDVWDFLCTHYPIAHNREAHILAGHSTGGLAAYHHAIKHRNAFGVAIGINPPLNLRWTNKEGYYQANFNPYDWGWRTEVSRGHQVLGMIKGINPVCIGDWFEPLYGLGMMQIYDVADINPIEMLSRYQVGPGQIEMYVAYGGQDELNIDAQVESFLYTAKWMGLNVGVGYDRYGRHGMHCSRDFLPGLFTWLAPRLAPYSPIPCEVCGHACQECECVRQPHVPLRQKLKHVRAVAPAAPPGTAICPDDSCGPNNNWTMDSLLPYPVTLPDPNPKR
jgi:S-formylglutathione hydrolase FrmB